MGADPPDGTADRPVTELRNVQKIVMYMEKMRPSTGMRVRHGGISGAVPFVWHRMPGFGDTNWRDIISILRSNGYEDDICIEGYHDPVYNGELEMIGQLHALNYLNGAEAESSHQLHGRNNRDNSCPVPSQWLLNSIQKNRRNRRAFL